VLSNKHWTCDREELDLVRRCFPFPPTRLTNIEQTEDVNQETTIGEILKFMGLHLLMTQYEFGELEERICRAPLL
jgi:hypothetical protein